LLRIRFAQLITCFTLSGAEAGAIAFPFTSLALAKGLQFPLERFRPPLDVDVQAFARSAEARHTIANITIVKTETRLRIDLEKCTALSGFWWLMATELLFCLRG
jgi:hypothetical protein